MELLLLRMRIRCLHFTSVCVCVHMSFFHSFDSRVAYQFFLLCAWISSNVYYSYLLNLLRVNWKITKENGFFEIISSGNGQVKMLTSYNNNTTNNCFFIDLLFHYIQRLNLPLFPSALDLQVGNHRQKKPMNFP